MKNLGIGVVAVGVVVAIGCGGGGGGGGKTRGLCAANLKKLHDVIISYANDYDDILPPADWNAALAPYLEVQTASLRCPAVPAGGFGYALNVSLVGAQLNSLEVPDATPLVFDSENLAANAVGTYDSVNPRRHHGPAVVFVSGRTIPEVAADPVSQRDLCRGNLRQVATAAILYANDNDDLMPPAAWMDALTPYATGQTDIFRCPSVAVGSYGYAFNAEAIGIHAVDIPTPATFPMAFDSSILTRNAVSAYALPNPTRHDSGVTAYLDGHVSP